MAVVFVDGAGLLKNNHIQDYFDVFCFMLLLPQIYSIIQVNTAGVRSLYSEMTNCRINNYVHIIISISIIILAVFLIITTYSYATFSFILLVIMYESID